MGNLLRITDYPVWPVLPILLKDKTTKRNIIWATASYASMGEYYTDSAQMTVNALRNMGANSIQPRILKTQEDQQKRTRTHGEVQTPAWLCCRMNDYLDTTWFERGNVFNTQDGQAWFSAEGRIVFPEHRHSSWRQYIDSRRLEITCGEAPFIVSRYDAATGEAIPIERRIGMLDRKLRIVGENTDSEVEWVKWAIRAVESVYGYEYQGDNLLIARINVLMTFVEYLQSAWHRVPTEKELVTVANVISWNFWQMDGLMGTVPKGKLQAPGARPITMEELGWLDAIDSAKPPERTQKQATELPCRVRNWLRMQSVPFNALETRQGKDVRYMKFDFVIGNPPYQEETAQKETENGQKAFKNIFQYFQLSADEIAKEGTVLVYPAIRWIHRAGKGMKEFGYNQINDPKLTSLTLLENAQSVFPSAQINDGISIVVKDISKTERGFQYTYIPKEGEAITIHCDNPGEALMAIAPRDAIIAEKIDRFVTENGLTYLSEAILPRSLFGIESDFVENNPNLVRLFTDDADVDFSKEIKLFTNDKARSSGRTKWYVTDREVIKRNVDKINEWQVTVLSANAGGQRRDSHMQIIDNHSAFGRSRVALRSFITLHEAENFAKYISSNFVRYAFLLTNEALSSVGKRVPDILDYSDDCKLIDYNSSIDEQLSKQMGLTTEEIEYINSRVNSLRRSESN